VIIQSFEKLLIPILTGFENRWNLNPSSFWKPGKTGRSLRKFFCDHKKGFLHFKPLGFEHEVQKNVQRKGSIASFGKLGVSDM
jgi:hypothetical protein